MIKNNPYDFLARAGVDQKMLGAEAKEALQLFKETMTDFEAYPDNEDLKKQVESVGKSVIELIEKDVQRIAGEAEQTEVQSEKHKVKKHQSKKTIEKTERTFDDLDLCRERLRDDRRKKVESGEIAKPKKKTLTTKLRLDLVKIVMLIPKNLKDDADVLTKTRRAILKFLTELKGIWGLDRIKPIEDDLNKRFEKLEDEADRLAANN